MKFRTLSLAILSFVFLVSVVFAKDYDLSVSVSPKSMKIYPCGDPASFDVDIDNLGELEDTYSIAITGLPDGWYSLSEDSINLGPGESGRVYLFVTASCSGEIETGIFKVFVTASDGASASDSFTLEVIPDRKIQVTMPEEIKTCLQESLDVEATIKNGGNYTEDVTLTLSGSASDFAELKEDSITLEPFEEKNVNIAVIPTGGTEVGDYDLELEAKSTSSYAISKDSGIVNVVECYKVDIKYPEKVETCVDEVAEFEITIENIGLKKDSYELSIEELNYTEVVELEQDESKTFAVSFLKDEVGSYDLGFVAESDFVKEEGTITFDVLRCYGAELSVEETTVDMELGRGKLIKAKITNLGAKSDTFEITSDVDWVSIKPDTITLEPNESEDIYVYYSPKYGMTGTFETVLSAASENSQSDVDMKLTVSGAGVVTTVETAIKEGEKEETTTVKPEEEVPTGEAVGGLFSQVWDNKILRALMIAVIVVIIILIIVYLVVMR
jgi:uncharacterized membrane protein